MTRTDLKAILIRYATWLNGDTAGQNAAIQLAHEQTLKMFGLGEPTKLSFNVVGSQEYVDISAASPAIMTVIGVTYDQASTKLPLEPIPYTRYRQFHFRRQYPDTGTPTHYAWEAGKIWLWPTPSSSKTNGITVDAMTMYGASYDMADDADTVHPDIVAPDIIALKAAMNEMRQRGQVMTAMKEVLPGLRAAIKEQQEYLQNRRRDYAPDVYPSRSYGYKEY